MIQTWTIKALLEYITPAAKCVRLAAALTRYLIALIRIGVTRRTITRLTSVFVVGMQAKIAWFTHVTSFASYMFFARVTIACCLITSHVIHSALD